VTTAYETLYRAALAADAAYSAELFRLYKYRAGDARYDKRGTATPRLTELAAEKIRADEALLSMTGTIS
jgi:hypothetical protein